MYTGTDFYLFIFTIFYFSSKENKPMLKLDAHLQFGQILLSWDFEGVGKTHQNWPIEKQSLRNKQSIRRVGPTPDLGGWWTAAKSRQELPIWGWFCSKLHDYCRFLSLLPRPQHRQIKRRKRCIPLCVSKREKFFDWNTTWMKVANIVIINTTTDIANFIVELLIGSSLTANK